MEGEEEGGFTVLEFTRKYITCDKNDLPITVSEKYFVSVYTVVQILSLNLWNDVLLYCCCPTE